ncbi:hypothetical protein BCV69DRAFT_284116 [Microstroma glucosiphilum]|uniref:Exocyst complex component Sec3 PIP2-binding N-terminal domain-containing protein n=1 Tax=Pseudomicrostroma glucosiphilum TaxID=1684307 RepID=A0A316U2K6_9BASI|nr:hypothetical protein BCV69DRAFT_284116 [Pseudomicrostroma glucosiphilum]PWN19487.1 hypothetical protein BCV69DRAFT_284116 [Pseudomicrostroma glucosiphilum]
MSSLAVPAPIEKAAGSNTSSGQSTRDAFNAALRSRNPQNNYIAHLKIWEPVETENGAPPAAGPVRKARYLILAVQRDTGRVTVNKAKRNANGSFSIGKDWDLNTLKVVEVIDPTTFSLTLSRPYQWTTDRGREQHLFLSSMVNVYRRYTRSSSGPRCIGITVEAQGSGASSDRLVSPSSSQDRQPEPSLSPPTASSPSKPTDFVPPAPLSIAPPKPSRSGTADSTLVSPLSSRPPPTSSPSRPQRVAHDPIAQSQGVEEAAPAPPVVESPAPFSAASSSSLLSPLNRRPTIQRETSAGPVLQRTPSSSLSIEEGAKPESMQLGVASASMSRSRSFQSASSAGSAKDTLSDRLARAASGAKSGSSTPTAGRPSTPESAPPARPPPAQPRVMPPASAPPVTNSMTDSQSAYVSPSKPTLDRRFSIAPTNNARARLSAVEPIARGGKAYEKMLLAGTGLKSIGDEDEEEEEEEEEELLDETAGDLGRLNGDNRNGGTTGENGMSKSYLQVEPIGRKNTLKASKSLTRKATRRQGNAHERQANGSGANEEGESDEDDATLVNVEELLEGIDFRAVNKESGRTGLAARGLGSGSAYSGALSRKGQGTADVIEANLLSELEALDSANIHSILTGDDRLASVLNHVDAALAQLDSIDSLVASFKMSLNSRAEDINFIEGQNRGLQVMNSNWRALEKEIEQLQQTVNVPQEEVTALLDGTYHLDGAIESKEAAAASLYKAILQAKTSQMEETNGTAGVNGNGSGGGMAATTERLDEYSSISNAFGTKSLSHLQTVFTELTTVLLSDPARKAMLQPPHPRLTSHEVVEQALSGYCGLMLYLKEVEPRTFERISAAYLTSAAERYNAECSRLAAVWKMLVRKASEDEDGMASFVQDVQVGAVTALSRATTVRRLGGPAANRKGKSGGADGEVAGAEAFGHLLFTIIPLLIQETLFLSDFLHLNLNGLTFADYMDLETYFRKRAAALFGEDSKERRGGLREMKGAMDLVFGFLVTEVNGFLEEVERRDRFQMVGVVAALDGALMEAEHSGNDFVLKTLNKLQGKATAILERFFADQLRAAVVSASKQQTFSAPTFRGKRSGRGGLTAAVRIAPHFVDRIESQLGNAQHLNVRSIVDGFYARMENTIIDTLLSLKVETTTATGGQDEDKGAMNHQVLLIENMHHLIQESTKLLYRAPALRALVARAEKVYEDSLSHYTHFVLRRPLGKMMDFGDGIDALLRSTPANEVSLHNAYSKSSFRKLAKEHGIKDLRKQVDALWKRVLKHFNEDENENFTLASSTSSRGETGELVTGPAAEEEERRAVVGKVWRRCEHDFVREIERTMRIQDECYKGAGVGLEVKVDEVVRLFAR